MNICSVYILIVCELYATWSLPPTGFLPLSPFPLQSVTKKPAQTKPPFHPSQTVATVTPTTGQTQSSQTSNCSLNINVPQTNCSGGNNGVQLTLNTFKQELDQARKELQTQNMAVQNVVSQLRGQQSGYLAQIADLQNEVQNLVKAFNMLNSAKPISTPSPTQNATACFGVTNGLLVQSVTNVRNDLNNAIQDFNTRVFNLTVSIQGSQQQETRIHHDIEMQVKQQSTDIGQLSQQVKVLNTLLQQINSSSANSPSAAELAQLKAEILKVSSDIYQYETTHQGQIYSLIGKTDSLLVVANNHSSEIRNIQAGMHYTQLQMNKTASEVQILHDSLAQYRTNVSPRLQTLEADVKTLVNNLSSATQNVKNVGNSVVNLMIRTTGDTNRLNKTLQTEISALNSDVRKVQTDLNQQKSEIANVTQAMVNLRNAVPTKELTMMHGIVLQIINGTVTQTELHNLTQVITALINKLNNFNPTGFIAG